MSGGEGFLSTIMQIRASQNKQTTAIRWLYFIQFKIYKCHVIPEALPIQMIYERSRVDKMSNFTIDNADLLW